MNESLISKTNPTTLHIKFNARESELANLMLQGKNPSQISQLLNITTHSVKFYLKNVNRKLEIMTAETEKKR